MELGIINLIQINTGNIKIFFSIFFGTQNKVRNPRSFNLLFFDGPLLLIWPTLPKVLVIGELQNAKDFIDFD